MSLDPRTHAVRRDLADVRLADRVFAPHYAMAAAHRLVGAASLEATPGGELLASLAPGDAFELLEMAGGHGWGIAVASGLVGYVALEALGLAAR